MNRHALTERLAANLPVIRGLVESVSGEQVLWRPSPDHWSILEVINHLYDEEMLDFRARIRLLWEDAEQNWPGIDPQGWVKKREYQKRDPAESLANFAKEREDSICWLQGLENADWDVSKEHPVAGKMTAGTLFASWVAHDFLHLRQLCKLHYLYVEHVATPHTVAYAGGW